MMTTFVADMTRDELVELIQVSVRQTLLDMLSDPDEGLELRESVRKRLLRQKAEVEAGDFGLPFAQIVEQLGLN
jgi:hypothetical protein